MCERAFVIASRSSPAVFVDRDGVLVEDVDLLQRPEQIRVLPGAALALRRLADRGFRLICVTNQTVVARGLLDESATLILHAEVLARLEAAGAPSLLASYLCPHHPHADNPAYRRVCECRKPAPGMLFSAAREHNIDLPSSFLVGDRLSDVIAGQRAGCRTVLVETGRHRDAAIVGVELDDHECEPDARATNLLAAADWIIAQAPGRANVDAPRERA